MLVKDCFTEIFLKDKSALNSFAVIFRIAWKISFSSKQKISHSSGDGVRCVCRSDFVCGVAVCQLLWVQQKLCVTFVNSPMSGQQLQFPNREMKERNCRSSYYPHYYPVRSWSSSCSILRDMTLLSLLWQLFFLFSSLGLFVRTSLLLALKCI